MSGHVHAELMAQYAEDARETDEPWTRWEQRYVENSFWSPLVEHPKWREGFEYRRKPKTSRERFEEWRSSLADLAVLTLWDAWKESERQALELDK